MVTTQVPVLGPVSERLEPEAMFLVALGGAFYLIGIWPFAKGGSHPGWHVVWHFFVMAGAATHWFVSRVDYGSRRRRGYGVDRASAGV